MLFASKEIFYQVKFSSYILLILLLSISCTDKKKLNQSTNDLEVKQEDHYQPKYSLAQWSFNRELFSGEMSTVEFIEAAGELGFDGVEYVNQFFIDKVEDFQFLDSLNEATKKAGVQSLLIMVDNVGNLGDSAIEKRNQAIANTKKWVLAAKYLGCSAIRVNAHGDGDIDEVKTACIDGIGRLAKWSKKHGIDIIIENHGGHSNNGEWLASLVKELSNDGVGTLPDFDNWCTMRENGALWGAPCVKRYDRLKGMEELLPYAKSLSVKSFDFNEDGFETTIDYKKIFALVKAANYRGYLSIEYEGNQLTSREGILKTKALVEKVW